MTTIPAAFQKAIEAHEESERLAAHWERQRNIERAEILTRELRALELPVPDGLETPWVTIEGIEFTLTGTKNEGFTVQAHVYNSEGDLCWLTVYGLTRLGELVKQHYEVLGVIPPVPEKEVMA